MSPSAFQKLRGLAGSFFAIGHGGPQFGAVGGVLEALDPLGSAYALLRAALPAGHDDLTPKLYTDSTSGLPVPRVRQTIPGNRKAGRTRRGDAIDCYGEFVVSTDGLPLVMLQDPIFRAQIELGRYVGKRQALKKGKGYVGEGQGFYHPTPWIGGTAPPGSGGTRGGSQTLPDPTVNRPSEWPIVGLLPGAGITLHAADVFAPWCEIRQLNDLYGGSIKTLNFRIGRNGDPTNGGKNRRAPGYYPSRPRGVFAFRYAFFNPLTKHWVSFPWSEPVFARPKAWPLQLPPTPISAGNYPSFRAVAPDTPGVRSLAITVGGKVR